MSAKMAPIRKECDYLVIGGGSGGLASARRASGKYGAKTIAIESGPLGGTCVNVGCVPKKVTWNAASIAETFEDAKAYGFDIKQRPAFDWTTFKKKRDGYVERLNEIYRKNLEKDKVELLRGRASFVSKHEVEVKLEDGSTATVKAKKITIATGGAPIIPPIEGKELCTDSNGFFGLETQPRKVVLVGAGYIGVENAGMFHALGTETHYMIRESKLLRTFDPMIQDKVTEEYLRQGIDLHRKSTVSKVESLPNGKKRVHYVERLDQPGQEQNHTMDDIDVVLWAIGRKPEVDDLRLDNIAGKDGIQLTEKGQIKVDDYQNSSVDDIYALGDVCDRGFELTPVAIASGRRLADRLFGNQPAAHLEYENIPSVVFAHPEIGTIGLTEPAAKEKYGEQNIKVYTTEFPGMYYALMEQDDKGPTAYKLVCEGPEERIVGLHIMGKGSSEMLQGFAVAVKMGARKSDFDRCVAIHPVSAEELVTMT